VTLADRAHWLDILPALPLARSVPLRIVGADLRSEYQGPADLYSADRFVWAAWRAGHPFPVAHDGPRPSVRIKVRHGDSAPIGVRLDWLRVDLDDPQGFAWALRILTHAERGPSTLMGILKVPSDERMWTEAELHRGRVTDADRVALARALAEVTA
jgi:hypothetical protein